MKPTIIINDINLTVNLSAVVIHLHYALKAQSGSKIQWNQYRFLKKV